MKLTVLTCEQRSEEWRLARLGRLTGSVSGEMLTKLKTGGEAAGRRNLRTRLVLERLTGVTQEDDYQSRGMQHGADTEHVPLAIYEAETGVILTRTGFISCDELMVGCSLDGHVGDFEGIVEAKCPKAATHLDYLQRNRVPPEYVPQVTHDLWLTGAKWVDVVSYHEAFPPELQFFCVRAYREEFDFAAYEAEVRRFLAEVDAETEVVRKLVERARLRAAA